ncbi:hypothetical protein BGX33_000456 [Mortierella sp. NVP41]|nr:hypothetical protein BGX33_000456 [Mortierella sp. NVP41]
MVASNHTLNRLSPHRLLLIPELLEQIFALVDDKSIRRTVVRVCRQWFWMNRHRIILEVLWDSSLKLEDIKRTNRARLLGATHLYCLFRGFGRHDKEKVDWLLDFLRHSHEEYQESMERQRLLDEQLEDGDRSGNRPTTTTDSTMDIAQLFAPHPVKQLTLQGYVEIGMRLPAFLPYMASLTSLTIREVSDSLFTMSQLLDTCIHLELLHIESLRTTNLAGPWLPNRILNDGEQPSLPPFPLKTLRLICVQLPQPCLEIFLASTPYLQELKIVLGDHVVENGNDLTRLCQHLHSLPGLRLRSFHYSMSMERGPAQTAEDYARMMAVCPQSTDWTVQGSHLSFDTSRLLLDNTQRITTLEILEHTRYLHDVLCQMPHLLSVKAASSDIPYEYLDVFSGWLPRASTLSPNPDGRHESSVQRVWACRNLQTCRLAFSGVGLDQRTSRLVYGYVSLVCPNLRDVMLCFPDVFLERGILHGSNFSATLCMDLPDGFCLLTRLKDLERLSIGGVDMNGLVLESWAIDWMVSSASSSRTLSASSSPATLSSSNTLSPWSQRNLNKMTRQKVFAEWTTAIARAESKIAENVQRVKSMSRERVQERYGADLDLMIQLSTLGYLVDVRSVLEEIDSGKSDFWTRLERVAIYRTCVYGQRPEVEAARLMAIGSQSTIRTQAATPKSQGKWSWMKLIGL